ncbi:hypothetical protein RRG08_047733 [Elysia crispata]|uniref:Uncharacterized protein n=1 Tax=Elysia crispata TaxID=231223 RepID=A0AAE1A8I3_9GAST|nr:hypothetical protein RRG08_047733 [Elysia crispata]
MFIGTAAHVRETNNSFPPSAHPLPYSPPFSFVITSTSVDTSNLSSLPEVAAIISSSHCPTGHHSGLKRQGVSVPATLRKEISTNSRWAELLLLY